MGKVVVQVPTRRFAASAVVGVCAFVVVECTGYLFKILYFGLKGKNVWYFCRLAETSMLLHVSELLSGVCGILPI